LEQGPDEKFGLFGFVFGFIFFALAIAILSSFKK
jgi:hypothetical protein